MRSSPPSHHRVAWSGAVIPLLLLAGCCLWFFAPIIPWFANRMDYVQGKLDVIASYESRPGGFVSPGGRYLLLGYTRWDGTRNNTMQNLQTGARYPYTINNATSLCWLNDHQFIIHSTTNRYTLIEAEGVQTTPMTAVYVASDPPSPAEWAQIRATVRDAQERYVIDTNTNDFVGGGFILVVLTATQPTLVMGLDELTLNDLIADVTATRLAHRCTGVYTERPIPSPDGRYTLLPHAFQNAPIQIVDQDGNVRAVALKIGWSLSALGWAADSSGVYFRASISGGAASMAMSGSPIFKLSPMSPWESAWWWVQTILFWGAVGWGVRWVWRWFARREQEIAALEERAEQYAAQRRDP